ncbi:uncharacterized protein PAC_19206 [Phialocephala subalpina]|uniref:Uncharacterized protein n=1 Tax=Phialocephala subalpina TaxID=576137 RepID=A0A1L7XWA4_9HELO|nr:uncharacterized protein PAC_19206 [Phialocephala subalpina]
MFSHKRSHDEGAESDTDVGFPAPKRRTTCAVEGAYSAHPVESNQDNSLHAQEDFPTAPSPRVSIFSSSRAQIINTTTRPGSSPATATAHVVETGDKHQEMCLGMLAESRVEFLKPSTIAKHYRGSAKRTAELHFRIRADAITILNEAKEEVGVLDSKTAQVLKLLRQTYKPLRLELFMDQDDWKDYSTKCRDYTLKIMVYANKDNVEDIGAILSDHRLFLQEPTHFPSPHKYCNPHVLSWTDKTETNRYLSTPMGSVQIAEEVESILSSFSSTDLMTSLQQDGRIRTKLQAYGHQLAALQFMVAREKEIVEENYLSLWQPKSSFGEPCFIHEITQAAQLTRPCECRGGILADEMGMGKSLTLLALTLHTLGRRYQDQHRNMPGDPWNQERHYRSRATLIVAPKSSIIPLRVTPLLLTSALKLFATGACKLRSEVLLSFSHFSANKVSRHLYPDTLRVYLYHGSSTNVGHEDLLDKDIVLTTYETVRSDMNNSETLRKVSWLRVVLDEAHHIRNRSTNCFQAIVDLNAERRWCLTGTPIQNRLDDLFSLLQFLRFHPLENQSNARKYILEPLGRQDEKGLRNLRLTMRVISLRRGKQQTCNRRRNEYRIPVSLSVDERQRYNSTLIKAQRLARIGARSCGLIMLQSISALRQLCSHGSLAQFLCSDLYLNDNNNDHKPPPRATFENCDNCHEKFSPPDKIAGVFKGSCGHEICSECVGEQRNSQCLDSIATPSQCYICQEPIVASDLIDTVSSDNDVDMDRDDALPPGNMLSSKVEQVLSNLTELQERSDAESCNEPTKRYDLPFHAVLIVARLIVTSLVFSHWIKTLDTLGQALSNRGMAFVRIDGSLSLEQRSSVIHSFQSMPSIRIMLLSYGSGSVGLNLAAATHVHLMEPHWNPMVEAQAAARVDRLDQRKDIHIYRYIVKDSIEERIQKIQRSKIQLAKLSNCQTPATENSSDAENIKVWKRNSIKMEQDWLTQV